jgi:hypothetical protein
MERECGMNSGASQFTAGPNDNMDWTKNPLKINLALLNPDINHI